MDIAVEKYAAVAQDGNQNCPYFINKEQVMHHFLYKTEQITDEKLIEIFQSKRMPPDIIRTIMHYHYVNHVDYLVATRVIDSRDMAYYKATKHAKENYKYDSIEEQRKRVAQLLDKNGQ